MLAVVVFERLIEYLFGKSTSGLFAQTVVFVALTLDYPIVVAIVEGQLVAGQNVLVGEEGDVRDSGVLVRGE